jgi:cyclophilin family peptidyl-prolyl cis-trans isomerase
MYDSMPPLEIDLNSKYIAEMYTDVGRVDIQLDPEVAPYTVNSFIFLAKNGFYDNTVFHRVIKDFVVQGGDPTGTGRGGPGYNIPDEFPGAPNLFQVGSVAMANTGQPDSGGSQFFIVVGSHGTTLPPTYTIFGKVISGMSNIHHIALDGASSDQSGAPKVLHKIESISIQKKENVT